MVTSDRELLVATLAHDIGNTSAAIRLAAESLTRRRDLPADADEMAGQLAASATHLNRLAERLLDLLGPRERKAPLERTTVDLVALCASAVAEARVRFGDRKLVLDAPASVCGQWDALRLRRLLQNLLWNAIEHGDSTRPVRVRLRADGAGCVLDVHNHGALGARRGRGHGLGLFIAKSAARAHGGTLEIESSAGRGTTVRVRLPGSVVEQAVTGSEAQQLDH
jgi:signal transduction histidine kinase